jgi:hypothetical protein
MKCLGSVENLRGRRQNKVDWRMGRQGPNKLILVTRQRLILLAEQIT